MVHNIEQNEWVDYMRDFSPFVTLAGLKTQPGVAVKVLQKTELRLHEKSFSKRAGIFISVKLAEKIHIIAKQNIYPG